MSMSTATTTHPTTAVPPPLEFSGPVALVPTVNTKWIKTEEFNHGKHGTHGKKCAEDFEPGLKNAFNYPTNNGK
jgi:hypothetical protein